MKNLLLKTTIILIHIKIFRVLYITTPTGFFYYFTKNKFVLLLFFTNCLFKKKIVMNEGLGTFYALNLKCNALFRLKTKLNSWIELFYTMQNISTVKNLNYLPNAKKFVSVIRSPFVYKKSMDQFFYERYQFCYKTNVSTYNYYFCHYQYEQLQKILQENTIWKLACKINYIFN
jgi:hypothetical protein